ncbi:hypothetical protein K435DRAFT_702622, partial [Dendrothele bispora CBS 962.96]
GTFVPKDIHPHKLKHKEGKRINHSQFMTRESNEMRDHPETYHRICDALEPILRWVVEKVRISYYLFSEIETEVDIYPLNDDNPIRPFSSFVINLNVKTQAHRDHGDKNGCIVLVLGNHSGGGICLHEAKVVIETSHGDNVTFRSTDMTHFNLSYVGVRASIVIHSDRTAAAYQKNGFGWDANIYVK